MKKRHTFTLTIICSIWILGRHTVFINNLHETINQQGNKSTTRRHAYIIVWIYVLFILGDWKGVAVPFKYLLKISKCTMSWMQSRNVFSNSFVIQPAWMVCVWMEMHICLFHTCWGIYIALLKLLARFTAHLLHRVLVAIDPQWSISCEGWAQFSILVSPLTIYKKAFRMCTEDVIYFVKKGYFLQVNGLITFIHLLQNLWATLNKLSWSPGFLHMYIYQISLMFDYKYFIHSYELFSSSEIDILRLYYFFTLCFRPFPI